MPLRRLWSRSQFLEGHFQAMNPSGSGRHEAAAKSTSVPNAFPQDQHVDTNLVSLRVLRLAGKWSGRWESNISIGRYESFRIMVLRVRMSAACDFCVKDTVTAANASQCGLRLATFVRRRLRCEPATLFERMRPVAAGGRTFVPREPQRARLSRRSSCIRYPHLLILFHKSFHFMRLLDHKILIFKNI